LRASTSAIFASRCGSADAFARGRVHGFEPGGNYLSFRIVAIVREVSKGAEPKRRECQTAQVPDCAAPQGANTKAPVPRCAGPRSGMCRSACGVSGFVRHLPRCRRHLDSATRPHCHRDDSFTCVLCGARGTEAHATRCTGAVVDVPGGHPTRLDKRVPGFLR